MVIDPHRLVTRLECTADTRSLKRAETAVQELNEALQVLTALSTVENAALAANGVEKVRVTKHEFEGKPYPYRIRVVYAGDITETALRARLRKLIPADCELSIFKEDDL